MILSGRDIQWYIDSGKLKIDPVDKSQFQQNGVDLILREVKRYDAVGPITITTFSPGEFYLGVTREVLIMPDDLMAFVQLRSTWARRGILLPPTVVDAGFRGDLTLEIVPHKAMPVPIGERFAHLIFAKLTSPSEPYKGKYQDQRGVTFAKPDPQEIK